MGTHRFFIKRINPNARELKFPSDITHQIEHVLRLKKGDLVTALDGKGNAYHVEINRYDSGQVIGKIIDVGETKYGLNIHLHLFFPLSKKAKIEWILQKGTEVGVHAFHPFISQRSLVQNLELSLKRKNRWEAIIREAAEQSGRGQLPQLQNPGSLPDVIKTAFASLDLVIAAIIGESSRNLKDVLADTRHKMKSIKGIPSLGLFVGPEGGFSASEIEIIKRSGAEMVSLGTHILRLETAAIVFPAFVMYELNELRPSE